MRIRQLPAYLANQIAAGEVIERPASVLKELLENSLDAKADAIDIDIEKGGLKQMRITDNGKGIHKDDLLLAVSPHATSKLHTADDLFAIQTLGFRGEALASISSVARLQLTSCQTVAQGAWRLVIEGNAEPTILPTGHPLGTSVLVQDLFFNVPARRKFLRSEKTEFYQLEEVFRRLVLSNYNVSFNFKHNQRQLYQLPAANNLLAQEKRIAKIYGNNFLQQAVYLEYEIEGLKLWGWVGEPDYNRSQADLQYVYLNGRMVRDKLLSHALRQAYENKVYPGRYPLFLLYLNIDPSRVDVNVHPTKHEVRFHDSRLVHDFLYQSVRAALAKQAGTINKATHLNVTNDNLSLAQIESTKQFYAQASSQTCPINEQPAATYQPTQSHLLPLGILHDKYLLAQQPEGLLVLDVQRALFLLNLVGLEQAYSQGNMVAKPLLIPVVINLSLQQVNCMEAYQEQLQSLGVNFSVLSKTQLMLRGIPQVLAALDGDKFFNELIKDLSANFIMRIKIERLLTAIAKAAGLAAKIAQLDKVKLLAQWPHIVEQTARLGIKSYNILSFDILDKLIQQ